MTICSGNDLVIWRKENNLSQEKLADLISYSVSRIAHIEEDDLPLSKRLISRIVELDNKLNNDRLIIAWHKLQSMEDFSVKKDLEDLSVLITDLLTLDPNSSFSTKSYFKFLSTSLNALCKIKKGEPHDNVQAVKEEITPLVREIYSAAGFFLKRS